MTTNPARTRRSTNEVRRLITNAAYEEFVRTGLDGTSIRSIAERAGVTESMVFRHFTSKSELFQETAAGPLVRFMYEFAADMVVHADEDPRDVTFRFVSGLYELCMENRQILISLVAASGSSATDTTEQPAFEACLDALHRGVVRYVEIGGSSATGDLRNSVRMALTLVLGATLADKDLFPHSMTTKEIQTMLSDFITFGAGYLP